MTEESGYADISVTCVQVRISRAQQQTPQEIRQRTWSENMPSQTHGKRALSSYRNTCLSDYAVAQGKIQKGVELYDERNAAHIYRRGLTISQTKWQWLLKDLFFTE